MRKRETEEPSLKETSTGQTPTHVGEEQCAPAEINIQQEPSIDESEDPLT